MAGNRVDRSSSHYITRPDGDTFEVFKESVKYSVDSMIRAIEDIEVSRAFKWERVVFSGSWDNDTGYNFAGGKLIAADVAILRGKVTADSGDHGTAIGQLPPRLSPRFQTELLTFGYSGATLIPVALTISTSGVITPTWFSTPGTSFSVVLENLMLGLS